jgi:integrase
MTYDDKAIERGVPELVSLMLATGLRIGEAAAVTWDCVVLDEAIVEVRGTVLRLTGQGLVIKPSPNTAAGERVLEMPSRCVDVLRKRREVSRSAPRGGSPNTPPVFPAQMGGLRDPSNTNADLRAAFAFAVSRV